MRLDEVVDKQANVSKSEHVKFYKKLAKDLDLDILPGSTVGVTLPVPMYGGCWFGGTLVYQGGVRAEKGRQEGVSLPYSARVKHYLKSVAKLLEKKLEDGFTVDINQQPTVFAARTLTKNRDVYLEMHNSVITGSDLSGTGPYARLCWWISDKPDTEPKS